jgi:hypothetical protein
MGSYLKLVKEHKNARITAVLEQTSAYLSKLGQQMKDERTKERPQGNIAVRLKDGRVRIIKGSAAPTKEDNDAAASSSSSSSTTSIEGLGESKRSSNENDNSNSAMNTTEDVSAERGDDIRANDDDEDLHHQNEEDKAEHMERQYHGLVHERHERIKVQPSKLTGGTLKEYQVNSLALLIVMRCIQTMIQFDIDEWIRMDGVLVQQ